MHILFCEFPDGSAKIETIWDGLRSGENVYVPIVSLQFANSRPLRCAFRPQRMRNPKFTDTSCDVKFRHPVISTHTTNARRMVRPQGVSPLPISSFPPPLQTPFAFREAESLCGSRGQIAQLLAAAK